MARRHFTVNEVEDLIPALERTFIEILQLRAGLRALERKLENVGIPVTREDVLESDTGEGEVKHVKALFRGYYEALGKALEQVRALGGDVKDLEMGLVDFPGKRAGEEILLCWKMGEKTIGFWHPVNQGYSSRRPLDEQIPREPRRAD